MASQKGAPQKAKDSRGCIILKVFQVKASQQREALR